MDTPIFELRELTLSYPGLDGPKTILEHVNFALALKQKIGLYAPNGSGKTSLLRSITGLLPPKNGTILFQGQIISKESDFKVLRRQVGFVLQEAMDQIFFPSVLEDISFGPLNLGLSEKEAQDRAKEIMRTLGIENLSQRATHQLSGGEMRLVALAGILAMHPLALLLDEPTTALDDLATQRLISILQALDTAMIIVSHDLLFLSRVAQEFVTIRERTLVPMEGPVIHAHQHAHLGGNLAHHHPDLT